MLPMPTRWPTPWPALLPTQLRTHQPNDDPMAKPKCPQTDSPSRWPTIWSTTLPTRWLIPWPIRWLNPSARLDRPANSTANHIIDLIADHSWAQDRLSVGMLARGQPLIGHVFSHWLGHLGSAIGLVMGSAVGLMGLSRQAHRFSHWHDHRIGRWVGGFV